MHQHFARFVLMFLLLSSIEAFAQAPPKESFSAGIKAIDIDRQWVSASKENFKNFTEQHLKVMIQRRLDSCKDKPGFCRGDMSWIDDFNKTISPQNQPLVFTWWKHFIEMNLLSGPQSLQQILETLLEKKNSNNLLFAAGFSQLFLQAHALKDGELIARMTDEFFKFKERTPHYGAILKVLLDNTSPTSVETKPILSLSSKALEVLPLNITVKGDAEVFLTVVRNLLSVGLEKEPLARTLPLFLSQTDFTKFDTTLSQAIVDQACTYARLNREPKLCLDLLNKAPLSRHLGRPFTVYIRATHAVYFGHPETIFSRFEEFEKSVEKDKIKRAFYLDKWETLLLNISALQGDLKKAEGYERALQFRFQLGDFQWQRWELAIASALLARYQKRIPDATENLNLYMNKILSEFDAPNIAATSVMLELMKAYYVEKNEDEFNKLKARLAPSFAEPSKLHTELAQNHNVISQLFGPKEKLAVAFTEMRRRLGPKHPQVLDLSNLIK